MSVPLTGDDAARNRLLAEILNTLGIDMMAGLSADDYTRNLLLEQIKGAIEASAIVNQFVPPPQTVVTSTALNMTANNGYIANNASRVVLTLPAIAPVGSVIYVTGLGAGGWRVAQRAGQSIKRGNQSSTVGVTGYAESQHPYDSAMLLCVVANLTFVDFVPSNTIILQ